VLAFLLISATIIAYESIQNIQAPHKAPKPWALLVLGGIILWKEVSFQVVIRKSKETHSSSLKVTALISELTTTSISGGGSKNMLG